MNSDFKKDGYIQVKELISKDAAHILCSHAFKEIAGGYANWGIGQGSGEHPLTWNLNTASPFDSLITLLTPKINELLDLDLIPTYYYQRTYLRGSAMAHHSDRPSCERSCTLNIGQSHSWPIYIINRETGIPTEHIAEPGDCLLYMGCTQDHWRETFEGDWYMQIFLHWVERDGIQVAPHDGIKNVDHYWDGASAPVDYRDHYASDWKNILHQQSIMNRKEEIDKYSVNEHLAGKNYK